MIISVLENYQLIVGHARRWVGGGGEGGGVDQRGVGVRVLAQTKGNGVLKEREVI